jgi:methylglyoxal reductase
LRALKEQGKARTVGISVPDHRSDMVLPIVMSGTIDSVQTVINIFDPCALENLVPICQKHRVAVIARCILDEGGLTGFLTPETVFEPGDFRDGYFDGTTARATYIRQSEGAGQLRPEVCGQSRRARAEVHSLASGSDNRNHFDARAALRAHKHRHRQRAALAA